MADSSSSDVIPEWHRCRDALEILASVLLISAVVNWLVIKSGWETGTFWHFPLSVFRGPEFHLTGIIPVLAYGGLIWLVLRRARPLSAPQLVLVSFAALIAGNLGQGGVSPGLIEPLIGSGIEYADDALKIVDWRLWLTQFNQNQPQLLVHSQTHPPLAVLIYHLLFELFSGSVILVALALTLMAACAPVLFGAVLSRLGAPLPAVQLLPLVLLCAPGFNIYGAVSLDAVILSVFLAATYGAALSRSGAPRAGAIVVVTLGLITAHLLTFGALFLSASLVLWALIERHRSLVIDLAIAHLLMIGCFALLGETFGYNHLRAFATASSIENPHGFIGFAAPLLYLFTRLENIGELVIYLGLPVSATVLAAMRLPSDRRALRTAAWAGVFVLGAMFLSGAFRRGETGRACLFIYPGLLFFLEKVPSRFARTIAAGAAVQTGLMQLFGAYTW